MTLASAATAVGLWLVVVLVGYAVVAYLVLFYLPPVDKLESGTAADAAFVLTLPFVLVSTWLATLRQRG